MVTSQKCQIGDVSIRHKNVKMRRRDDAGAASPLAKGSVNRLYRISHFQDGNTLGPCTRKMSLTNVKSVKAVERKPVASMEREESSRA